MCCACGKENPFDASFRTIKWIPISTIYTTSAVHKFCDIRRRHRRFVPTNHTKLRDTVMEKSHASNFQIRKSTDWLWARWASEHPLAASTLLATIILLPFISILFFPSFWLTEFVSCVCVCARTCNRFLCSNQSIIFTLCPYNCDFFIKIHIYYY